ncbi:YkvA family protein [Rhizobium sp. FKY42]|uniref:YkvA family protein n=1 Tax=Rhizobium sp. FKY42 TaxID=2562310 RepID=UPI001FEDCEBB|nr:YkvA family protein [Rhizobium sp. FKY42]
MTGYLGSLLRNARSWARLVKRDVIALWLAARDPRVPLAAKLVAGLVAAYALSPIDLIPDFIPVLGYLDDVVLVPLGILLAVRLIPVPVMEDLRQRASSRQKPVSKWGMVAIIALWVVCGAFIAKASWNHFAIHP